MLPKEQFIEMAEKYMDMIFRIAFHYVKNPMISHRKSC